MQYMCETVEQLRTADLVFAPTLACREAFPATSGDESSLNHPTKVEAGVDLFSLVDRISFDRGRTYS